MISENVRCSWMSVAYVFHMILPACTVPCGGIPGPFTGLTLIIARISNYTHYNAWDEITYPSPDFNGGTVEVWEWISNFISHFPGHVITYPCWD